MTLFILASFLVLIVPGGQATPSGIHNPAVNSCINACRVNFGWPGHPFPNDPWGLVIDPKMVSSSQSSSVSSSVAAVPTGVALPTAAAGVAATLTSHPAAVSTSLSIQNLSSSSSSSSSSSPSSSSSSSSTASSSSSSATTSSTSSSSSTSGIAAFNLALPTSSTHSPPKSSSAPPPAPSKPSSSSVPPPPPPSPSPSPSLASLSSSNGGSGSTSGPTSQSDIQAYLAGHNNVRAQHGAAPLTYSQDLAAKAQQWANGCVFKHSGGSLGPLGENIAAGTGSGYGIPQALLSWTNEASQYNSNNPIPSHFTQVVWKATTQVGCALQNCNGIFPSSFGQAHYYVCEYSPQGNVIGEFGTNVQA